MKLTKRLFCLALVLALTFALCACGKKDEQKNTATPSSSTSNTTSSSDPVDDGNLEGDNMYNDAELEW